MLSPTIHEMNMCLHHL